MKKLDKEAIPQLRKFSRLAHYNEYNSNVVTMFLWNHVYEIFYEEHEHFILILVNYHHRFGWLMPLCEESYLKEAFFAMEKYSKDHHIAYEIHGMNQKLKDFCESNKMHFIYHNDIDAQDYVYDVEMQRSLSGKKMQKRRNHYNAFMKEYQHRFTYRPLKKDDKVIVFDFLEDWKNHHERKDEIETEMEGIDLLFDLFDELELKGMCIFIDDQLKAFSIYSELSDDMIEMHIEKADHSIRGLYVAILKYTLMEIDPKFKYLNREDDLGLESLRKAKSDLHPIYKVTKYIAYQGETKIIPANDDYKDQIIQLWKDAFQDEDEISSQFFFEYLYDPKQTHLLVHESKVLCMLQTRQMEIIKDQQKQQVIFIVGVATNPYYQKCGYMKKLLNHVLEIYKNSVILIQAYNWDLYKPFGFKEMYQLYLSHFEGLGNEKHEICSNSQHLLSLYQAFTQNKDGYRVRDLHYYEHFFIPYHQLFDEIMANDEAYIVVDKGHTLVSECIYMNEKALFELLNQFQSIDVIADIPLGKNQLVNRMMVKGDFDKNDHLYISEFY